MPTGRVQLLVLPIAALTASLLFVPPALASRIIPITVYEGDRPILSGEAGVGGRAATDPSVWLCLKHATLRPAAGLTLPVEEGRPGETIVRGQLRIAALGKEATVSEMRLIRSRSGDSWYPDPAWVVANAPRGTLAEDEGAGAADLLLGAVYVATVGSGVIGTVLSLLAAALALTGRAVRASRWLAITGLALSGLGLLVRFSAVGAADSAGFDFRLLAPSLGLALALLALWTSRRHRKPAEQRAAADGGRDPGSP